MNGLITEPGEYMFWIARFCSGRSGFSSRPLHSDDVTRRVNQFGSYDGDDTSVRISPVLGSSATTEPTLSLKYSSATSCSFRSSVRKRFWPGLASRRASSATSRPWESTMTRRSPLAPESSRS